MPQVSSHFGVKSQHQQQPSNSSSRHAPSQSLGNTSINGNSNSNNSHSTTTTTTTSGGFGSGPPTTALPPIPKFRLSRSSLVLPPPPVPLPPLPQPPAVKISHSSGTNHSENQSLSHDSDSGSPNKSEFESRSGSRSGPSSSPNHSHSSSRSPDRRDTLLAVRYDYHKYMHSGGKQSAPSIFAPTIYNRDSIISVSHNQNQLPNRWSASSHGSSHNRSHSAAPAIGGAGSGTIAPGNSAASSSTLAPPRSIYSHHRPSSSLDSSFLNLNNSTDSLERSRSPAYEEVSLHFSAVQRTSKEFSLLPGLPLFEPFGSFEQSVQEFHASITSAPRNSGIANTTTTTNASSNSHITVASQPTSNTTTANATATTTTTITTPTARAADDTSPANSQSRNLPTTSSTSAAPTFTPGSDPNPSAAHQIPPKRLRYRNLSTSSLRPGIPPAQPPIQQRQQLQINTAIAPNTSYPVSPTRAPPAIPQASTAPTTDTTRTSPSRSRQSPTRIPMPRDQSPGHEASHSHSRSHGHARSRSGKTSTDSSKSRNVQKQPSQKAMLSRALQKANAAVGLDNDQDLTNARQAYAEACELLQQVLLRTTAQEDKRKLETIRQTYTSRIVELDQMLLIENKSLPPYPDYRSQPPIRTTQQPEEQEELSALGIHTIREDSRSPHLAREANPSRQWQDDLRPPIISPPPTLPPLQTPEPGFLQSSFSRSPLRSKFPDNSNSPQLSSDAPHMTPHAIPMGVHALSTNQPDTATRSDFVVSSDPRSDSQVRRHNRGDSQNSWLDPIDESGASTSSSLHSRTSSYGIRRRHLRTKSGDTEEELDDALYAAIEAAYDDGYEPMDDQDMETEDIGEGVTNAPRGVDMAQGHMRQTEREMYGTSAGRDMSRLQQNSHDIQPLKLQHMQSQQQQHGHRRSESSQRSPEDFFDEDSSEEEERLLEEMRGYTVQEQHRGHEKKSSIPRESDSSGSLTANTWHSSVGSNPATGSSSLHTVAEAKIPESKMVPSMPKGPAPAPPPTGALPELPPPRPPSSAGQGPSFKNRRKSLQNHKQLKIETTRLTPPGPAPIPVTVPVTVPATIPAEELGSARPGTSHAREGSLSTDAPARPATAPRRPTSPVAETSPPEARPLESPFKAANAVADKESGRPSSPSMSKLRKNFSASSLRSLKNRNMSISNLDDAEMSPGTPSSAHWNTSSRAPAVPILPTPLAASLRDRAENANGGLHLLDDNFHAVSAPLSPNHGLPNVPVPLEPCPTDFMLRPFWLMRCLYQTLVHPKGGYLSSKLFVPRDVWRVKGAKLKNIEDKIANCDFLTAALLKLARVDTCDADAMLEEMQSMEGVLEQTQASLARKLGNEVGVNGAAASFKEAYGSPDDASTLPRSSSVSGKSSFSWRRLRSQKSAAALGNLYNNRPTDVSKDTLTTLPMTSQPTSKPAKRDLSHVHFDGPNAHYMGSLARLFDAAQVIDQIARQVEDPGLRHADKTQVGLELCTRHAAEFFGFYICRFVLTDLGILMDKFIKRGSEWVLA